nr:MAG TPA_asm: hypothetical protein [Caudoviricetes sp.]
MSFTYFLQMVIKVAQGRLVGLLRPVAGRHLVDVAHEMQGRPQAALFVRGGLDGLIDRHRGRQGLAFPQQACRWPDRLQARRSAAAGQVHPSEQQAGRHPVPDVPRHGVCPPLGVARRRAGGRAGPRRHGWRRSLAGKGPPPAPPRRPAGPHPATNARAGGRPAGSSPGPIRTAGAVQASFTAQHGAAGVETALCAGLPATAIDGPARPRLVVVQALGGLCPQQVAQPSVILQGADGRDGGRADLAVHGDAQAAGIDGPLQDAGGRAGADVVQGVGMGQSQSVGQRVALAGPPVAVPVNDQGIGLFHHPHVERGDLSVAVFVRDGPQVVVQGHTVLGGASGVARIVGVRLAALLIHREVEGPHESAFLGHMVSSGFGGPEKARPRAATMWRHGAAKKVEGVQRFSMSEAFLRFYWQLFRKQCKKRCRAMMPATFFRPKWYKCHR